MTALEQRAIFEVLDLELRQRGGGRSLSGRFPYRSTATVRDRGRVRKETFGLRAFAFAVEDEAREIHLLSGHSFDKPLASKRGGTLKLEDRDDGLSFEAELPDEAAQPSWMRDTVMALQAGLIGGISPGFAVPPPSAVANAETLVDEPGNPGVQIRVIRQAVLHELSLVTRPSYPATEIDLRGRADDFPRDPTARYRRRAWL